MAPLSDLPARLEPPKHLVELAIEVSGWSPCQSKRGVVIFNGEMIVAHGHNYKPKGFTCDASDACKATCRIEAVHAEQEALLSAGSEASGADMLHVKTANGALVASGGPSCVQCSKLIFASGIAAVWLYHADGWQRYEAAEFHRLSLAALVGAEPVESDAEPPKFAGHTVEATTDAASTPSDASVELPAVSSNSHTIMCEACEEHPGTVRLCEECHREASRAWVSAHLTGVGAEPVALKRCRVVLDCDDSDPEVIVHGYHTECDPDGPFVRVEDVVGAEPPADPPRITTPCPVCGMTTLVIGSGGHLVCSSTECPNPAVEDALSMICPLPLGAAAPRTHHD